MATLPCVDACKSCWLTSAFKVVITVLKVTDPSSYCAFEMSTAFWANSAARSYDASCSCDFR